MLLCLGGSVPSTREKISLLRLTQISNNKPTNTMWRRSLVQSVRRLSSKESKSLGRPNEVKPKAYAPPTPNIKLHNDEAYVPKSKHQRVSFEYPQKTTKENPSQTMKAKRILPIALLLGISGWGVFAYKFITDDTPSEYLSPDKFIPFIVTNKLDIDKDHYFIELTPKFSNWKSDPQQCKYWNGNRLWSIEVKQPQIMVVRKYTPLPLELYNSEFTNETLVRIQDCENMAATDGKLVFYIKKYNQGEVARWIHRQTIGSEIELRGPYTEFEFQKTLNNNEERPQMQNLPSKIPSDPIFPLKPDNLVFYAAGTGIAPALQLLLTKSPYRGFINLYYSHKTEEEVPIPRILFFLEKLDRAKFTHLIQDKETLGSKHVRQPSSSHYTTYLKSLENGQSPLLNTHIKKHRTALDQAQESSKLPKDASLALVCGPDGYVEYVAGNKPYDKEGQGPIGGLLKQKGWDETNVYKL